MSRCKEITKLISDSMERKLSLWQRIDLRVHLILCGLCRRFQINLRTIRMFANREGASGEESAKLSVEAKARIRLAMKNQSR